MQASPLAGLSACIGGVDPGDQRRHGGKTLAVHVPMTFRNRGGRKVVIAPMGAPAQTQLPERATPQPGMDEALVKTLAQAFHFQRLLDEGHYATVGDLARARKLDRSFVSRVLRLTLLAPDIVEAILNGRQAPAIQRQALLRGLPRRWEEQRAAASTSLSTP